MELLVSAGGGAVQKSRWLPVHTAAVYAFLYLPIVTLVVYSFNGAGVGGFPPRDLTLNWYLILLQDGAIWVSVQNSLIVAVAAVGIALGFGIPAALALDRADFPGKAVFRRLVLLPLILPGIITGLSILMLVNVAQVKLSLATIILGHGTALISVATTEIFAGLQKLDRAQEEASLDLGATPWQTFWRITLPNLKLSLIAAGLLIFTLSMDEIAVTFFLIGRDNTLPLEIYARLRQGITPEINAISTLIFAGSVILILIWYRIRSRAIHRNAGGIVPMSQTRRDFIKFALAGSVAAGCPIDRALMVEPQSKAPIPVVEGDHFKIPHEIRDGHSFPKPQPSRKVDVLIIGGGVAGLSSAYFLRGKDWLLLEKEEHFGGNAYQEEYHGQAYGTGSAYGYRGDDGDHLAKEIGVEMPFVAMPDPVLDNGVYTADPWKAGLNHLPYSKEAIASLGKFRDDVMKMDLKASMAELDSQPFSKFLSA